MGAGAQVTFALGFSTATQRKEGDVAPLFSLVSPVATITCYNVSYFDKKFMNYAVRTHDSSLKFVLPQPGEWFLGGPFFHAMKRGHNFLRKAF